MLGLVRGILQRHYKRGGAGGESVLGQGGVVQGGRTYCGGLKMFWLNCFGEVSGCIGYTYAHTVCGVQ